MYKQVDEKLVPLTPEFAKQFSDLPAFKGDRSRETTNGLHRIQWLNNVLQEGRFHSPTWAVAKLNGLTHRVNGGHSSKMLTESNGIFPKGRKVFLMEFTCETMDDLAELFSEFDNRRSLRTSTDKIGAHKAVHASLDEVSNTTVSKATSGIATFLSGCGAERKLDEDERARLVHTNQDFICWANQFIGRRHMSSPGCVAAMYGTFAKSREQAQQFWTEVMEETNPIVSSGSRRLGAFLRTCWSERKSSGQKKWTTRAVYAKSIHGWNAWRTNSPTELKYFNEGSPLPTIR